MAHIIRAQTAPGGAGASQAVLHPPNREIDVQYLEEKGWSLPRICASTGVFLTLSQTAHGISRAQAV